MTLILALATPDYLIQLSDRRLTRNGHLVDDESNKAGYGISNDSRFLFGFSGLAKNGSLETQSWILTLLAQSAGPDYEARKILERFTKKATHFFQSDQTIAVIPPDQRRLSLIFTGFLKGGEIFNVIVTNFQDLEDGHDTDEAWDEFRFYPFISKMPLNSPYSFVQRIGNWSAMTTEDEVVLRDMLIKALPWQAVRGKAIAIIREMADRPAAMGLIGKQLSSACLFKNQDGPVTSYHTETTGDSLYSVDLVNLRNCGPQLQIKGIELKVEGKILAVPKVGGNQPCPCKSGKKYKNCHGKM